MDQVLWALLSIITIGLVGYAWYHIRSKRKQSIDPNPWLHLQLYAVAASITENSIGGTYMDTHTRTRIYAVRAYSQVAAEELVLKDLSNFDSARICLVSIEIPNAWLKEAKYA